MKKYIPHIVKRQLKEYLRQQESGGIVPVAKNTQINQDNLNKQITDKTDKYIIPFLTATIGNRISEGFKVLRTNSCSGMQVFVTAGVAYFDISKRIETQGGDFYTVSVPGSDSWVYIYLQNDGTITSNTNDPFTGNNVNYIVLAAIWIRSTDTSISSDFIKDLRPDTLAAFSEVYDLRRSLSEIWRIIPNSFIGTDNVTLSANVGTMNVTITPNSSRLAYIQGHVAVLPASSITITTPGSGITQDYYIVAHGYIDTEDMIMKIAYYQIETSATIPRYQCVIGKISGVTISTTEITAGMISMDMQRHTPNILDVYDYFNFKYSGNLVSYPITIDVAEIVQYDMKIDSVQAYLETSYAGSGLSGNVIIDILVNGSSIFRTESGYDHRLLIPVTTIDGTVTVGIGTIDTEYLSAGDIITVQIVSLPTISGFVPKNLLVQIKTVNTTVRSQI